MKEDKQFHVLLIYMIISTETPLSIDLLFFHCPAQLKLVRSKTATQIGSETATQIVSKTATQIGMKRVI